MTLHKPTVYLAGPVSGLTFRQANGWRAKVRLALLPDIESLNPLRGFKPPAGEEEKLGNGYKHVPMATDAAIFRRDHLDATRCSLLFANFLTAPRVSIFSIAEVAWAYDRGIPVVLAIEPDRRNTNDSLFLEQVTPFRFHTLPDAIDATREILLPS